MKTLSSDTFALGNFEGSLDFLLHLVQKNEIDIAEISLEQITHQYLKKLEEWLTPCVENGAEFIGITAHLLFLKSRMLLPRHEQEGTHSEDELDPRFEVIHQLLDYCRFKEAAKELAEREQKQGAYYLRGMDGLPDVKKVLGLDHLSLEDLATLFQQVLAKSSVQKGLIHEEIWRVGDKIKFIRQLLKEHSTLGFEFLFSPDRSRPELIVTFLAILELMKLGELIVAKDNTTHQVVLLSVESLS
jgi:segregation and condensation protein A